jgi:hypothetical protein
MSSGFRPFILKIANELLDADRVNLEYYLEDEIPAGKREALRRSPSIVSLFEALEKAGHIGPGKLEFLKQSLKDIGRIDLASKVEVFDKSSTKLRLRQKPENYVKSSWYYLCISGGTLWVNDKGDDYVYVRSGDNYQIVIVNSNNHRVICEVKCDGQIIFPAFVIRAKEEQILDRPCHTTSRFTFFAVKDAPADSGIDARNTEENGVIQVTFTPEIHKMTITCDIGDGRFHSVTCWSNTTDVELHSLILREFKCDERVYTATVLVGGCKPLGKHSRRLEDYGIGDGSRVLVNFGLRGGVNAPPAPVNEPDDEDILESIKWVPGATTMQGQSEQRFERVNTFVVPDDETRKVVLHLRLIARADDETPINGNCTPFVLGNRRPPPV